jgi:hypothetical protein
LLPQIGRGKQNNKVPEVASSMSELTQSGMHLVGSTLVDIFQNREDCQLIFPIEAAVSWANKKEQFLSLGGNKFRI